MQELSLVEGANRRDFVDVIWQIADKRCCDEVIVRYDCGHAVRADVWAPSLPKRGEYGSQEAERRRFMQHSIFVLTKDPAAPRVQITVPEGRCRHCSRGQRQVLICGPLHMDLSAERRGRPGGAAAQVAATARRLELPLSSHTFLAAMGQACRLPENLSPPPLVQASTIVPNDGTVSREGGRQWSRREVEDALKADLMKYVGFATVVLLFVVVECVYLFLVHVGPFSTPGAGATNSSASGTGAANAGSAGASAGSAASSGAGARESASLDSGGASAALEAGVANSTWALSALTASASHALGSKGDGAGGGSFLWSLFARPAWLAVSTAFAPVLWITEVVVAIPRFLVVHVCLAVLRHFIVTPFSWIFGMLGEVLKDTVVFVFHCIFARPTAVISRIPMTNPMVVALVLSLLVAALSAPQPPSLSLPGVWEELPGFELARGIRKAAVKSKRVGPIMRWLLSFWSSEQKDGGHKGGVRGIPASKGPKDKPGADRKPDAAGRPDRLQAGRADGRAPAAAGPEKPPAPACFVCLDRPSRYVLEPCGHRVVCGECAMQLVETSVGGHRSERGGACPSCGMSITRAMRLFS